MIRIKIDQYGKETEVYISTDAISSIEVSQSSDGETIAVVRLINGMSYVAKGRDAEEILLWLSSYWLPS